MKVVEDLQQKGIFQLKGNISTVAKKLEISEKTLYRYLKNQS
nr:helix-turn-helix domain-containing protein [Fusobacterium necrophorum]